MAPTSATSPTIVRAPSGWDDPRRAARRVWWLVAILLNLALLPLALSGRATAACLVALLVVVLARHDGVVTMLGHSTINAPAYRRHQLISHMGQLHRAMALAGIGWLLLAAFQTARWPGLTAVLIAVAVALGGMAWTARESARVTRHNRFELIHHYVAWPALGVLVAVLSYEAATAISTRPTHGAFWLVSLLVVLVAVSAHPWMTVRRVPVEVLDVTPGLVVLALPGGRRVGDFQRVSLDGREWHSFAVSTCGREGPDRYCLVIRRAGDWTERLGQLCESSQPPASLLVRQLRGFGFMGHAQAYRRVLVVATGAGIGPVLLYLLDHDHPGLHCLWIGHDHRTATGADLVDRVLAGGQVTLVDTAGGRPDLAQLVTQYATTTDAVFVVSNGPVRDQVAAVCNRLRVRWYGPTFDS